ncbi:MAG: TadE/TadG family type IV pilus assembly protein [Methylocella sp.]
MTTWTPKAHLPVLTGHLCHNQRGVAAVEFALVATLLSFLLPAATDLALALLANQQVGNAARAGSEYAAINCWDSTTNAVSTTCASNVSTAATSATTRSGVTATSSNYCGNASASGVTQTCVLPCACTSGPTTGIYVSVTASTSYTPIFPAMWGTHLTGGSLNLSATSVTRIN